MWGALGEQAQELLNDPGQREPAGRDSGHGTENGFETVMELSVIQKATSNFSFSFFSQHLFDFIICCQM